MEVFEFTNYKIYLNAKLDEIDGKGRGARANMSRSIACQTAYTAQVLRGNAHFSLEQGEGINEFLGHTEEQGQFFLLLMQIAKAGTTKLRSRFEKQLQIMLEGRNLLKNRLEVGAGLAEHEQVIYYSSWHFGAIHALISVPGFQTPEKIADRLSISKKQVSEALDFLVLSGLLEKTKKGELQVGKKQIHLGADSPLISKHHMNWRLQAMRNIEQNSTQGLHYSSVISISDKDCHVIREKLVAFIKDIKAIIRKSKEENTHSFCLDFFKV